MVREKACPQAEINAKNAIAPYADRNDRVQVHQVKLEKDFDFWIGPMSNPLTHRVSSQSWGSAVKASKR
jgi:hypothetical protein